jgi:predicted membrane protein
MMLNTNDKLDTIVLAISWLWLVIRSLYLFEWYTTIIFIAWLIGIGLWYAFKMWSMRREAALMLWGILIAIFSYLQPDRIFFWLNIFFALFSGYYLIKNLKKNTPKKRNLKK